MLITALEKEREEIRKKEREAGRQEGLLDGHVALLKQLLLARFGSVPDNIDELLDHCTLEQLQALVNPVLDTSDLDTFLTYIPEPEEDVQDAAVAQSDDSSNVDAADDD